MKTNSLLAAACLSGMLLATSCGTDKGDITAKTTDQLQETRKDLGEARADSRESWQEERDAAVKDLRDLRSTLENRRTREQKRMDDRITDTKKRAESAALITELNTNIARIDASLAKLAASTATDWNNANDDARKTSEETRSWWSRQMENIDKKTDADNDKDGH
jgi:transketolase